jgi:hypothetical protein
MIDPVQGMEMHRIELFFAVLRRGILQLSQTHCVYMIEPKEFDAAAAGVRESRNSLAR